MNVKLKNNTNLLLDSSLILTTFPNKIYDIKLVECGSFSQIYLFDKPREKFNNSKNDDDLNLKKILNNVEVLNSKNDLESKSINEIKKVNEIDLKNIMRSKLQCQRIAKANMEDWKSFITLTFKENIKDSKYTNKKFRYFVDKIQRINKNFKYLCITEFQKRGAIHYHLLTNLECDSEIIPKRPLKRLYNPNLKKYKNLEYYDIKYWNDGFSSAEPITNDIKKVVGYISKYMTKDLDNRLFNKHRYFYSRNLIVAKTSYIDLKNKRDYEFFTKKVRGKDIIYHNEYLNTYDNSKVTFLELQ